MTDAFAGAGILESYSGLTQSIQDDSASEGEKVLDVSINAVGAVADTVAFAMDPLAGVLTAGVGWLLEHISFLREPLDMLLGNPDEINAMIDALKTQAADVRGAAEEHKTDVESLSSWSGEAADAFKQNMQRAYEELESLAKTMDTTATVTAVSGTLVIMLRDIVRDLIASLIAALIEGALIAAATAIITFGASIAGFIGYAIGRAAALAAKIAGKVAKLIAGLARQGTRLAKLGDAMADLSKGLDRFSMVAGTANDLYQAGKPYESNPQGAAA